MQHVMTCLLRRDVRVGCRREPPGPARHSHWLEGPAGPPIQTEFVAPGYLASVRCSGAARCAGTGPEAASSTGPSCDRGPVVEEGARELLELGGPGAAARAAGAWAIAGLAR